MFEYDDETIPQREERIRSFWKKNDIFQKSLDSRSDGKEFVILDGPPFATGLPHYGHLLAGSLKDSVGRYKSMQGYFVPRQFGWDCHGLPVEREVEQSLGLYGAKNIKSYGIDKFNKASSALVCKYQSEWRSFVERSGRWVDMDQPYRTMDINYMNALWGVFAKLWDKGLIYQGFKVMHYSPALGTPISNFEANLNYKSVDDIALTLQVAMRDGSFALVWTTTPWTLPANVALAVNSKIDYCKVSHRGKIYIVAKSRLHSYFNEYDVISTVKGSALVGMEYDSIFGSYKGGLLSADFVTDDEGSGIVHIAPAYGEDDFALCKELKIPLIDLLDENGYFNDTYKDLAGCHFKDDEAKIIGSLKNRNFVYKIESFNHRYPFCWRSDKPLIYRALSNWFMNLAKLKDQLVKNNNSINWIPTHLGHGRFGRWLENARDWVLSRDRYWGTPIPIWRGTDDSLMVVSSLSQLEDLSGQKIEDMHPHIVDGISFKIGDVKYTRVGGVFDCWFESGSMPYASNRGEIGDFVSEGMDQTRGWFYTLNVISTAISGRAAFKSGVAHGIVLAEDGQKMSKRLRNYSDPMEIMNESGADALRFYLLSSVAVRGENFSFSKRDLLTTLRKSVIPFWSSFSFLSTYANLYDFVPQKSIINGDPIDRWALSLCYGLVRDVELAMDSYKLWMATDSIFAFIENLTNWYIRRNRSRIWSGKDDSYRRDALETIYISLITLCKVVAPFMPFICEAVYLSLKGDDDLESVHLNRYPKIPEEWHDSKLESDMSMVRLVVNLAHGLRKRESIKVRQPLPSISIISRDSGTLQVMQQFNKILMDELNVKKVLCDSDESKFVTYKSNINFSHLKSHVGEKMGSIVNKMKSLSSSEIDSLINGGTLNIEDKVITKDDLSIERIPKDGLVAASSGDIVVVLDRSINDDLRDECIVRELTLKINGCRKSQGLNVDERISLNISCDEALAMKLSRYADTIKRDVLATSLRFAKDGGEVVSIEGYDIAISIERINQCQ